MSAEAPTRDPNGMQPPTKPKAGNPKRIGVAAVVVLAAVAAGLWFMPPPAEEKAAGPGKSPTEEAAALKVKNQPVIEYNKAEKNRLMEERKASLGVKDGLDLIVKEGESIKVGDQTVSVKEISDAIQAREGGITEKDLLAAAGGGAVPYGIHVVQPGENIWNIHFKLLKAYLASKSIVLPNVSDEPDRSGYSSAIGKLLKFSENMVYIYNIHDRRLVADINLIQPLTKIVIYRMDRVFELLDQVDVHNAGRIQFDGENIWIPAD
jgi:hypothetical protein